MRSILCFNNRPCDFREELRGHDDLEKDVSPDPHPYYRCGARSLEEMQPCILDEDKDVKSYGVKVLVKDPVQNKVLAWEPKKVVILRTDRAETFYGPDFESKKIEV